MAFTLPDGTPLDLIRHGLGDNILDYAIQRGYTGPVNAQGGDVGELASILGYSPEQIQAIRQGINANPNGRTSDDLLSVKLSEQARDKQALDWLTSQGYQAAGVDTGLEWYQQLLDPSGNLAASNAFNYNNTNKGVNQLGMAGALLVGGAAAMGGLGGAGAAGAGGTGTLGAGAPGAGITTQGIGATELAGLGLSNPAPLAMAPTFGSGAALTTAGIGASELAGLGLSNTAPLAMAPSASGLAGIGGAASAAAGASGMEANIFDLLGSDSLGSLSFDAPGWLKAGANLVGGGQNLAGLIGGIAGATQGGKTDTTSVERKTDPRFDPYLYGDNGYLAQLQKQFNATRNGNADMTAGADMLRNIYTSPAYGQSFDQMRSAGRGLLSQGVAGNPFTNPGSAPAGLLGGFTPAPRGQMPGGLLPVPEQRKTIMPVIPGRGGY